MTYNNSIYFYSGGQTVDHMKIANPKHQSDEADITIMFGYTGSVTLPVEHANNLLLLIAERLFDDGTFDTSTAERLSYLANIVAMDPREREEIALMSAGVDF